MADHEGRPDWEDYEPDPGECTHDDREIVFSVGGVMIARCPDCGHEVESPS